MSNHDAKYLKYEADFLRLM